MMWKTRENTPHQVGCQMNDAREASDDRNTGINKWVKQFRAQALD